MNLTNEQQATHRITMRKGKGVIEFTVALVEDTAYRHDATSGWEATDFTLDEDGEWTMAGEAFAGSVETLPKPVPCCSRCGGTNVESTAWIEYREDGSERPVNGEGPFGTEEGNWCHDCQEHLDILYPSYTPEQHKQRQENQAAREHGPELLDALLEMVPMAHSHLLDRVKLMCGEDRERGELESDGLPSGWELAARYRKARQLIEQLTKGKR